MYKKSEAVLLVMTKFKTMTMRHFICGSILSGSLLCGGLALAQDGNQATLQSRFPKEKLYEAKDKIVTMVIENDYFGTNGSDENYTSGVRFSYFDINADMPYLADKIDGVIPTFDINDTTSVFYSFGQNLYTPRDITRYILNSNDRPYAAHLYGSIGLTTITDNHLDEVEVSAGVIGPAALGKQTQKFVHKYIATDSNDPKGWDGQLKNEPTLGVGWTRRYPHNVSYDFEDTTFGVSPYYGLTLGNVYTHAKAGVDFRLVPYVERWQDAPVRVRPGHPGTGYFDHPDNGDFSWYLFAGAEGRAIAQNIFLDGNTFTDSHNVDKKPFVADLNAGAAITIDNYRLSYTLVYRTKEFKTQQDEAIFGALALGYKF